MGSRGRRGAVGWFALVCWLGLVASFYLGGMLLYAALLKASDPVLFIEQMRGYRVFPQLAPFGAHAFLWAEFIIGLMLILRVAPRWSLLGFIALMLFFVGVTAYAWAHGHTDDCGCFGRMASRPPKEVILEDLLYVALGAFACLTAPWVSRSRGRWMAYALVLPLFLALPWIGPKLPVDSLVTSLRPGVNLETLAAEDLKVPLGDGTVFVAMLGDRCRACDEALPMMGELAKRDGGPKVTGIFVGDRAKKRAWALDHMPAFPLANASEKVLRQYYRTLPVFVLLQEGVVKKVWWNRAPTAERVMGDVGR